MMPKSDRRICEVKRWVTTDDREHHDPEYAEHWARQIDKTEAFNEAFAVGATLGELLPFIFERECPEILKGVRQRDGFTISHWQCRDEPGYLIWHINTDGTFYVGGHAGSWSGSYSGNVDLMSLARYAKETQRYLSHR